MKGGPSKPPRDSPVSSSSLKPGSIIETGEKRMRGFVEAAGNAG
jgi:hypothetical protein